MSLRLICALADLCRHHITLAGLAADPYQNRTVYIGIGSEAGHHIQGILHITGYLGTAHLIVKAHRSMDLSGNAVGCI